MIVECCNNCNFLLFFKIWKLSFWFFLAISIESLSMVVFPPLLNAFNVLFDTGFAMLEAFDLQNSLEFSETIYLISWQAKTVFFYLLSIEKLVLEWLPYTLTLLEWTGIWCRRLSLMLIVLFLLLVVLHSIPFYLLLLEIDIYCLPTIPRLSLCFSDSLSA